MTIDHGFCRKLFHHGFTHFVTRFTPNVDDIVVTLLRRHETRRILLVDFFNFACGFSQNLDLGSRNQHVAHRDRNTATCGQAEARLHQFVSKNDGVAQTTAPE